MTIETSLDGVETHQATPNQALFLENMYKIKKKIKNLSLTISELRREDIETELKSIYDGFEVNLRGEVE